MKQTFYMVFVEGQTAPTYRHSTYDLALTESKRLSEMLKRPSWVLQAVAEVEKIEFTVTPLIENNNPDSPF